MGAFSDLICIINLRPLGEGCKNSCKDTRVLPIALLDFIRCWFGLSDQTTPASLDKAAESLRMNYFKAAFLQENETKMSALEVFTLLGGESLSDVSLIL